MRPLVQYVAEEKKERENKGDKIVEVLGGRARNREEEEKACYKMGETVGARL